MSFTDQQTQRALQQENSRLRAQLDEAQQLIDALKHGDVDALMIGGSGGEQLQALGDAEKSYRQLVEAMSEGAFTLDPDGLILYANRRLAEMLKTPLEKLVGSKLDSWCATANQTALCAFLQSVEASATRQRGEFILKAGDGSPIPVLLSLSRIPGDENAPRYSLIATDLSEQKQNEAIAADERLARSILEQATDAIVVCDESGWIIRSSRAAEQLCACQPTGSKFEHCFALQDDNGHSITLQQLLDTTTLQGKEFWFARSHTQHLLQVSTAHIMESEDTPAGTVITLNDVTQLKEAERQALDARNELQAQLELSNRARLALLSVVEDQKQTERALRESEAHFRLALSNLPISVWNMDADLRYIWVYEHEKGKEAEKILGKTDAELYSRDDAAYIIRLKQQVLDSGKSLRKDIYATVEGRQQFYNLYIEALRDEAGEITGLTGASVNVTNIRELEESRKSLSDALKQSASAIAMMDCGLNFEFVNQAFTELLGFTQDELFGQPMSLITPPDESETLAPKQVREIASKETIFRGEVIRKHKSGELIPAYLTKAPLKNTDGDLTGFVASYSDLRPIKRSEQQLKEALTGTISAISHTIEKRDPYTAGHQQRVAQLSTAIARSMGLDELHIEGIYLGSLIHDIGKIYIPAEILNRPGKLSEYEFGMIKSHPDVGYEIIKDINFDWPIAKMVYQHHERLDGTGYPQGLKGDEICLEAKIISTADIVEAMTSHRPYRPGLGQEAALKQIESEAGISLDKDIVAQCLRLFREKGFSWEESSS